MRAIRSEFLAAKLQALRNWEIPDLSERIIKEPRLVEALWFVERMSRKPGGLQALAGRLVETSPHAFQSSVMRSVGEASGGRYSLEQCLVIWKHDAERGDRIHKEESYEAWLLEFISEATSVNELRRLTGEAKARFAKGFEQYNFEFFSEPCRRSGKSSIAPRLVEWCEHPEHNLTGPWCCPDLVGLLYSFMDAHAVEAGASLASTKVTRIVFDELDFAMSQRVPVPIIGDSRFGKTKSISTWCEMYSGRTRLVTVPQSNREWDFYAAHADALGIDYGENISAGELERKVKFVLRHSGLFIVYDEAQFLIPINYSKTTPPRRLNWVRCEVIDRDLCCAFFATPQTYNQTLTQYAKVTGYRMEQWLGRLAPAVVLPAELDRKDLVAVAKVHFPNIDGDLLQLIAARAMRSEGYLKNLELTAKRAQWFADKAHRKAVTLDDVERAIAKMMPGARNLEQTPQEEPGVNRLKGSRGSAAERLHVNGSAAAEKNFAGQDRPA